MKYHRDAPVQHLRSSSSALLLTLGLAWGGFGVAAAALGRPKTALVHAGAVLAVAILWAATRHLQNRAVRRAHGGAAISVAGLCGIGLFSLQGASLACWYLPLVPMFVAQVAGWRAVAGWSLVGLACWGLVALSERLVVVEPEHVFTVLDTQIGALVVTALALGYSAFTRHIAERRLDEDEERRETVLEQAQELAKVHATLAQLHEEVLSESTAKSRLMAQVSHEIRVPLTGLLGLSEVLADAPLDAVYLEMVRALHASASALRQLVEDLLDVTRIQEGRLTLHLEPIDLRDLVGDVVDTFAVVAQRKGIDLAAVVDAAVPASVTVDALRVRQIASNLLANALKFTQQGEVVIHVSGHVSDGVFRARIEVRDTGSGIDPDVLPTLFDAFEQGGDDLPLRRQGTGLGLWIARELARALSGELDATSELGRGSRFFFTFIAPSFVSRSEGQSGLLLAGLQVLVVDGHEGSRDALGQLSESTGIGLVTAVDLATAVKQLKTFAADVVVVDEELTADPGAFVSGLGPLAPTARFVLARPAASLSGPLPRGYAAVTMKPYRASRLRAVLMDVLPDPAVDPQEPGTPRMRCLVVDDDETNRMVARILLERAGQDVVLANTTAAAEAVVRGGLIDLVFLDVHMPGEGGIRFVRRLRADFDRQPPLWVVALTAAVGESERTQVSAAGMDDFLGKPIEVGLLRATLERGYRGIRRRHRHSSRAMTVAAQFDDAQFDDLAGHLEEDIVPLSEEFVTGSARHLADLRSGVGGGDIELAHRAAHTLAASSAMVGATSLAELSRVLEAQLAKGESPSRSAIDALFACREQSVVRLRERVRSLYPPA